MSLGKTNTRMLTGTEYDQWNSAYTAVRSQSAASASVYSTVNTASANWNSVYSSFNAQSGANAAVYSTTNSNSGNWNSVYSTVFTTSGSWGGGGSVDTGVRALTGNWQNTYTTFSTQSANNASVYSTVNANSAQWASTVDTGVRALTAVWQSTYTSFNAQSASNASVYSTVNANSAQWASTVDTGVRALTAVWQGTYTSFNAQSANNASVYSTVNANSALFVTQFNDQNTSAYTLTISDRGKTITDDYSTNTTITVPSTATVNWAAGDWVRVIQGNKNSSNYTRFSGAGGVTIRSYQDSLSAAGNWAVVNLLYKGIDTWYLYGDLKTQAAVQSTSFTVYSTCASTGATTVYSSSNTMGNSIVLYTDNNLTTLYSSQTFYYGSPIREYTTNGSGVVTEGGLCYATSTTYTDCSLTGSNTRYTLYGAAPSSAGYTLYTNSALSTPAANEAYVYSSSRYTTNGSGIIATASPINCPTHVYAVYTDCTAQTIQTFLRSSLQLQASIIVYTDDALNIPYADQTFYGGTPIAAYTTNNSGQVTLSGYCFRVWDTKATCNDERDNTGSTTSYYTYYADSVLQSGDTVYINMSLTTPATNATFVKDGYVYTTNGSGVLGTPVACIYSLTEDANCNGSGAGTIYTNKTGKTAATLYSQGATIYTDSGGTTPRANATIHITPDSNYFTTDNNGVVDNYYSCST